MSGQPISQRARAVRARLASERGFALIELLVVILVIGILSAIAIASYLNQAQKGQDTAAKSQVKCLQNRVEDCVAERDAYSRCDTGAELGGTITGIDFSEPTATPPSEKVAVEAPALAPTRSRPPRSPGSASASSAPPAGNSYVHASTRARPAAATTVERRASGDGVTVFARLRKGAGH